MSNKWIWFNIGQKGNHGVTWQCGVIKDNFDPETIKLDTCKWDENNEPHTIWVKKEEVNHKIPSSVAISFENLEKVAEWIKQNYETGEPVYVGHNNWTHIYDVYNLDNVNEYGVAIGEWEDK